MTDMACCGVICDGCKDYQKTCNGCNAVKGKPYWVGYVNLAECPLYTCCVAEKGFKNCGHCDQLPCGKYYECVDPSMTPEEHEQTVRERVDILKKFREE